MLVMKASKLEEVGPIQPEATGQAGNSAFPGSEAVGVDKIRDLLFGNQMQDYDRRFSMLEERFLQRFRESNQRRRVISAPLNRVRRSRWSRSQPSFAKKKTCAPTPTRRSTGSSASIM